MFSFVFKFQVTLHEAVVSLHTLNQCNRTVSLHVQFLLQRRGEFLQSQRIKTSNLNLKAGS
jgi:hypothetical protein